MADTEVISLEIDERPAVAAVGRANAAMDGMERKSTGSISNINKKMEESGDVTVRVTDRSRSSIDRLVASTDKLAASYGKTGVERLILQRDQLIQRLGNEQAAVDRVTASYAKMIAVENSAAKTGGSAGGGSGFNPRFAFLGAKDVLEGRSGNAIAELSNEILSLGGTTQLIVGVGVAVAGIGFAAFEAHKKLKELAEEPAKLAAEFSRLNDPLHTANDEMRVTNDKLENTIAKLSGRPQNGIKLAFDEAAVAADHLASKIDKILGDFTELLKKNEHGFFARALFRQTDDSDIEKLIGGESGFGGMRGDLQDTRKQGGDVDAVISRYRDLATQRLRQAQYSRAVQHHESFEGQPTGGLTPPTGLSRPELSTVQDSRIEKYKALIAELDEISDSRSEDKRYAADIKTKDGLEAVAEAARKAAEAVKQFHTAATEFAKRGDEAGLDAVQKIYYERDRLIAQASKLKGVEADVAAVRKAADEQAIVAAKKLADERLKVNQAFDAFEMKRSEDVWKERVHSGISWDLMGGPSKGDLKDTGEMFNAKDEVAGIQLASQRNSLNQQAQHAMRVSQLSGADGLDAIRQGYQIRVDLARQLADLEMDRIAKEENGAKRVVDLAKAQSDIQKEMDAAHEEALIKTLELQRHQLDEIKNTLEPLYNTLLTKPQDFGKQLSSTVKAAALKPITEGLSSMTAKFLYPTIFGKDGGGGIAGSMRGMFGGGKLNDAKLLGDGSLAVTVVNHQQLGSGTPGSALGGFGGWTRGTVVGNGATGPSGGSGGYGGGNLFSPSAWFGGGGNDGAAMPRWDQGGSGGGYPVGGPSDSGWFGGSSAPGGTPGFAPGSLGLGGSGVGGSGGGGLPGMLSPGGFSKTLSGLKGSVFNQQAADAFFPAGGFASGAAGVATSPLATTAGMMLAQNGLLGSGRGTTRGIFEGGLGGGLVGAGIGFQLGGPMGALLGAGIGAAAGFGIGIGEKLFGVETPENEAKRLVKQMYQVSISSQMASQIAQIAKQKYGGQISIAVRDPDVRQMITLYAAGTGQKVPFSATTPRGAALAEQNGNLYQTATSQFGVQGTYASNLPVLGGGGNNVWPGAGGSGPTQVSLHVSGQDVAGFMTGSYVTPGFVADQSSAAMSSSYGRTQNSATLQQPGLIVS